LERQLAYWQRQLAGAPAVLELPSDRPRPAVQRFRGAVQPIALSAALTAQLQHLARQASATLFMVLLAAFNTLLHYRTGQNDIVVGTDVANRNCAEVEGLIGFFVNLLALRTDLSGNPTFQEVLTRVREVVLEAYAHQDLPFDQVVEALRPMRQASHDPLVQVLFVLQNVLRAPLELPNLHVHLLDLDREVTRFDFALFMEETAQGLSRRWQYRTDLFNTTTMARLAEDFVTLLHNIVAQPQARLHRLDLLMATAQGPLNPEKKQHDEINRQKFIRAVGRSNVQEQTREEAVNQYLWNLMSKAFHPPARLRMCSPPLVQMSHGTLCRTPCALPSPNSVPTPIWSSRRRRNRMRAAIRGASPLPSGTRRASM
jgi:non-ribosomal peptide synthetase component F